MKELFENFIRQLQQYPSGKISLIDIRNTIRTINEFFYTTYRDIGTVTALEQNFQYFSDFHKFWKEHHAEILDFQIAEDKCAAVADVLHNIRDHYGDEPFAVTLDTANLPPEAIAQVRYFTANQDFRLPLGAQFSKYREDCSQFDAATIYQRPVGLLEYFELTGASQSDKRADYARNAAKLLIDRGIDVFDLAEHCDNDAVKIRRLLTETANIGYGDKKANMFIRDMWSLGVWTGLQNIDKIDVASDVNTMKVALRTGIVKTAIPLLSSFLDIFGYQYILTDAMCVKAWRRVWEIWKEQNPNTALDSPAFMDFFLYNVIGRKFCNDRLYQYRCTGNPNHTFETGGRSSNCQMCQAETKTEVTLAIEDEKKFYVCNGPERHHIPKKPGRLKYCPQCRNKVVHKSELIQRMLPCMSDSEIARNFDFAYSLDGKPIHRCFFVYACQPQSPDFIPFDPPKSISIKGRTGWTEAYSDRKRGGGGLSA